MQFHLLKENNINQNKFFFNFKYTFQYQLNLPYLIYLKKK